LKHVGKARLIDPTLLLKTNWRDDLLVKTTRRHSWPAGIEETFKTIFASNKQSPAANRPPIAPQDLLIQEFDGTAVATFHLGNDATRQRRTFVLRCNGDDWKIVHLHASAIGAQP
jgi:hypothetical protein